MLEVEWSLRGPTVQVEATMSAAIQTGAVGFTARRNRPGHMEVPASEDTGHETHKRFG
jgi:hypothetical protein